MARLFAAGPSVHMGQGGSGRFCPWANLQVRGKVGEGSPQRGCLDGGEEVGFDVSILPNGTPHGTRARKAPGHVDGHKALDLRLDTHTAEPSLPEHCG